MNSHTDTPDAAPEAPKKRKAPSVVTRSADGRKVFTCAEIGREIGRGKDQVENLIKSGELDVCKKIGKTYWAWVADLDRWLEEHSS